MRGVVIADPETVADPVHDVPDKAPVGVTGEGPGPVLPPERGGAAGQLGWEGSREVGAPGWSTRRSSVYGYASEKPGGQS